MNFAHLVGDLVLGAEDVRVVLGEAAHAHEAVQRAVRLVAVAGAELGQAERQVAVGLDALVEDLHVAGAVHRLERMLTRFSLACSSSISVMNMFSRYLSQWPEASQSLRSTTCGVRISL